MSRSQSREAAPVHDRNGGAYALRQLLAAVGGSYMGSIGLLAIAAWLVSASVASAEILVTYVSEGRAYFTIAVPDDWSIRTGFEADPTAMPDGVNPVARVVSAMPEDEEVLWLGFWVPGGVSDLDQARAYLTSLNGFLLDEPQVERTSEDEINGVQMRFLHGNGQNDGERMEFTVGLFQVAEDAVAVAILIGRPAAREAHREELQMILNSFTPARP